jgi:hypothetical protein
VVKENQGQVTDIVQSPCAESKSSLLKSDPYSHSVMVDHTRARASAIVDGKVLAGLLASAAL